jgi:hypothetical protein
MWSDEDLVCTHRLSEDKGRRKKTWKRTAGGGDKCAECGTLIKLGWWYWNI